MSQNDNPIIVGLDIGTTKIAAIAGRKNEFGKLEILGFGRANSNGVQHGQVLNIDQTIRAIHQALENCQKSNPDLEINEVYVGIAGHHIKSLQTRGDIVRQQTDEEIKPFGFLARYWKSDHFNSSATPNIIIASAIFSPSKLSGEKLR